VERRRNERMVSDWLIAAVVTPFVLLCFGLFAGLVVSMGCDGRVAADRSACEHASNALAIAAVVEVVLLLLALAAAWAPRWSRRIAWSLTTVELATFAASVAVASARIT
jgi:cytochrome bd-type quinol oxidase subunit 2